MNFQDTIQALVNIEDKYKSEIRFQENIGKPDWYGGEYDYRLNENGKETKERFVKMREDLKCIDDLVDVMVKFGEDDLKRRNNQYQSFVKNEGYRLGGCRWIGNGKGISFPPHIWRFILGYALQDFKISMNGAIPQKGHYRPFTLNKYYKFGIEKFIFNAAGVRIIPSWKFVGYCNGSKKNVWFEKRETNHATPMLYEDLPKQKVALEVKHPYDVEFELKTLGWGNYENYGGCGERRKKLLALGNWLTGCDAGESRASDYGNHNSQSPFWWMKWKKGKLAVKTGTPAPTGTAYENRYINNAETFEESDALALFLESAEKRLKCLEENYATFHIKRNCVKLTDRIRTYFHAAFEAVFLKKKQNSMDNELGFLDEIPKLMSRITRRMRFYLGADMKRQRWNNSFNKRGKTESIKIPQNKRSKTFKYFEGHNIAAYGGFEDMD